MRILQVNKFLYRRGGAEGYMIDLADLQRSRGHEVEFFGMQHPENPQATYEEFFPSYVEFEPPPSGLRERAALVGRMMWSPSAARGMSEVLRRFQPDVVHLHNIYHQLSPSVLRPIARAGIPAFLTLHDYKLVCPTYQFLDHGSICTACVTQGPMTAARRRCKDGAFAPSAIAAVEVSLHRRLGLYSDVAAFICPSEFLRSQVAEAGVAPDRLVQVNNFTDLTVRPRGADSGGPAVFAGRLSHEKGVDVLIDAIGVLAAELPSEVLLRVAGDGPLRESLTAQAERVAPGRIEFLGRLPREELVEVMRSASVAVIPSRWLENMPLSVLEAAALGLPVVGSALGGLIELIEDGVTGALVPAESPSALAAAMAQYLTHPERSEQHGRAARKRVEMHHDPVTHADQLDTLYLQGQRA